MRYVKLGKTDLKVSTIAFGGYALAGTTRYPAPDDHDAEEAVRASVEEGVNFFIMSAADGDGLVEQRIGRALGEKRKEVVLATKVLPVHYGPKELRLALEQSLRNLDTTYIDLYQLDGVQVHVWLEDQLAQLEKFRVEGKIRAYGLASVGKEGLARAVATKTPPCSLEMPYSLLFRAPEYELLPLCLKHGLSLLCDMPLMHGMLAGRFIVPDDVPPERADTRHFDAARGTARHGGAGCEKELFAAIEQIRVIALDLEEPMASIATTWLAAQKGVASAVVGARNAAEARRNARAGRLVLPPTIAEKLSQGTLPLKTKLGPNPDMWEVPSRFA